MIMEPLLYSSCVCTEDKDNVFGRFSFISKEKRPGRRRENILLHLWSCIAEFDEGSDFKSEQIARRVDPLSMKSKKMLTTLNSLTVSAKVAAKLGLHTRHITIKNRGGLLFASQSYYELMSKIEDMFYSTIMMRDNFALARPDRRCSQQ